MTDWKLWCFGLCYISCLCLWTSLWVWQQRLFTTLCGNVRKCSAACWASECVIYNKLVTACHAFRRVVKNARAISHCACNQAVTEDVISLRMSGRALGWQSWCVCHRGLLSCQAEKVTALSTDGTLLQRC